MNKPLRLANLELKSRYVLAPLAGYTTLGFRLAVRELGGLGLATTDLISARALLIRSRRTMEMLNTCPEDRPLAVQIYGNEPPVMREAAQWLEAYGVSAVDINMGCPVHKVTRGGGGSAMMCDAANTVALVRSIVEAVRLPVTVKMRLGWDEESLSAPFFAREFEQAGVAGITIHGRTRAQGFGGNVSLDGIRAVAEAVKSIPVIGNGDVRTPVDAERMLRETGCTGVAIGRGALLNPWIFGQLVDREKGQVAKSSPTYHDRLAFMGRHFHLLVTDRGERFGCLMFRKVANWYCRVLRPGREIQQRLVRIATVAEFEDIAFGLRERGYSHLGQGLPEPVIPVPRGPVERW
jgi:nifR3 family TIM-barrel protein